jgi:hypothetical protein
MSPSTYCSTTGWEGCCQPNHHFLEIQSRGSATCMCCFFLTNMSKSQRLLSDIANAKTSHTANKAHLSKLWSSDVVQSEFLKNNKPNLEWQRLRYLTPFLSIKWITVILFILYSKEMSRKQIINSKTSNSVESPDHTLYFCFWIYSIGTPRTTLFLNIHFQPCDSETTIWTCIFDSKLSPFIPIIRWKNWPKINLRRLHPDVRIISFARDIWLNGTRY